MALLLIAGSVGGGGSFRQSEHDEANGNGGNIEAHPALAFKADIRRTLSWVEFCGKAIGLDGR